MADSSNTPDQHAFSIRMDDGAFWLQVECPYDRDNEARPCWPHDEDGAREPAPQVDCTYEGWVDAVGPEDILYGELNLPLPTACVVWDQGMQVHCGG